MPNRPDLATRCLDALTTPNKGRVKVVREALSAGLLNDPKFAVPLVGALSDRSGVFADTLADEILPEVGVTLLNPLRDGFDELPEPVRFRHLRVIHGLAPEVAKECARRSARAKHVMLSIECLKILAGSERDAALLVELAAKASKAGGRARDRSFHAYQSLAGIGTTDVREFLRERLIDGEGFPNLAVAYHPDVSLSGTILELLEARIPKLESGEMLSECEAEHLVILLKSAAGQDFRGFDGVLSRCVEIAATRKDILESYFLFAHHFTEFTLEAVASNPVEKAQRCLVGRRGEFGVEFQIFAFNAAARLDDIPLFETFEPFLEDQNLRARCRGWECSCRMGPWPCSIVSALKSVREGERGPDDPGEPLPQQAALIEKIRSESRWDEALAALGAPH